MMSVPEPEGRATTRRDAVDAAWFATDERGSLSFHTIEPSRPESASAKVLPPATRTSSNPSPLTSANAVVSVSLPPAVSQTVLPSAALTATTRPRSVTMTTSTVPSPLRSPAANVPRGASPSRVTLPSACKSSALNAVRPLFVPTRIKPPADPCTKSGGVVAGLPASPERISAPVRSRTSTCPFFPTRIFP